MSPSFFRSVATALVLLGLSPALAADRVRLGVLAFLGAEHSLDDWAPTISAIRTALGPGVSVEVMPLDHAGLGQALAQRGVDFVITNPGHYVELELKHGISRILTLQSNDPVASTFVVRADEAQVQTIAQVRGKRLAIVGREAFGGYQVGWRELRDAGVDPEREVTLKPVGLPMTRVLEAVATGEADVGVVRACLLERQVASGSVPAGRLKAIGETERSASGCVLSSRQYPDWPIAKARETAPELAKLVATALLSWTPPKGEAGWTVPLDYQPVHELFRALKIGPYEHLRHETLTAFLWRVRHWLLLAGVVLVGWLVHVVRVERLVRRRTAELAGTHADLMREMAARRLAEQRDALHLRELDHAGRLSIVGEMASGLAHELNQPLAAIVNYASGCTIRLKSGGVKPEDLLSATERIQQQAERAAKVIQQMRAFVRKRDQEMKPCDLNAIVQETLGLFEGMVRRAGATVTVDLAEALPVVLADKVQIQQVLLNLFQNALEAMKEAAPQKRLSIATRREGDVVVLSVSDSGAGLTEAVATRVFEPFFTTKPEGLGLGLALCKTIMEAHQGHLEAAPREGGGTVMTVRLPVGGRSL